jgi:hypothetical protein
MFDILSFLTDLFNQPSAGNLIGGATWLIAFITLLYTIYSVRIGKKAYSQIEREEPWRLTKIGNEKGNDHWMLERVHPIVATLVGEIVFPRHMEPAWEVVRIPVDYCQVGTSPFIQFRRGTKIVVTLPELPAGSLFRLYYRDHKRRFPWFKKLHPERLGDYRPNISPSMIDTAAYIETWETPLY